MHPLPNSSRQPTEPLLEDVLEHLLEGFQVLSPEWRYLYVNSAVAAQAHRTREALLGRTMQECFPGIDQTPLFAALRRSMEQRVAHWMENEFTYPDGSKGYFQLLLRPVPQGLCVFSTDVTERKRAEARLETVEAALVDAQRLEAVGRLAGGVVHDFNNLLSVVLGYSELLLQALSTADPAREDLSEIRSAGARAAELTGQLLEFSRKRAPAEGVSELGAEVADSERMLRSLLGSSVHLSVRRSEEPARCRVEPGKFQQALLNLVLNARDAMPEGGELTLATEHVVLGPSFARAHEDLPPGSYVRLTVSDTGVGMDAQTQERLFEPFFTTKERGRGTGLGLPSVRRILQQCGGHCAVRSEPGKGTTFELYFPSTEEPQRHTSTPSEGAPPAVAGATVLVVEDDAAVRALLCRVLRAAGYRVLEAANGGEALLLAEQREGGLDLLLSELVLPRLGGRLVARRIAALAQGLRVLFLSGGEPDADALPDTEEGHALLRKPFTPTELLCAVAAQLRAAR